MQPSASMNHDFERLNKVDRLLRLQNTATQLEILISRANNQADRIKTALYLINSESRKRRSMNDR